MVNKEDGNGTKYGELIYMMCSRPTFPQFENHPQNDMNPLPHLYRKVVIHLLFQPSLPPFVENRWKVPTT